MMSQTEEAKEGNSLVHVFVLHVRIQRLLSAFPWFALV